MKRLALALSAAALAAVIAPSAFANGGSLGLPPAKQKVVGNIGSPYGIAPIFTVFGGGHGGGHGGKHAGGCADGSCGCDACSSGGKPGLFSKLFGKHKSGCGHAFPPLVAPAGPAVMPGQGTLVFPHHPFARSPRDYFMED